MDAVHIFSAGDALQVERRASREGLAFKVRQSARYAFPVRERVACERERRGACQRRVGVIRDRCARHVRRIIDCRSGVVRDRVRQRRPCRRQRDRRVVCRRQVLEVLILRRRAGPCAVCAAGRAARLRRRRVQSAARVRRPARERIARSSRIADPHELVICPRGRMICAVLGCVERIVVQIVCDIVSVLLPLRIQVEVAARREILMRIVACRIRRAAAVRARRPAVECIARLLESRCAVAVQRHVHVIRAVLCLRCACRPVAGIVRDRVTVRRELHCQLHRSIRH